MAKLNGTVWLVGLAIYFSCFGMVKADEDADVRLVAETKLLFRTVLADETPPERCELEPTWQTYSIPESIAHKHFGLTLHAELSMTAPFSAQSLTDILDLADDGEFVCSADRAKSMEGARLRLRRTGYTFPVFSEDYKSAALVVSHSLYVKGFPAVVIGYVAIYKKTKSVWRRVTTIELFVS
jgi:hypothetical protein